MTPTEWFESTDPEPMLGLVLPETSDRKRRLFAAACCRRVEGWLVGDFAPAARREDYRRAIDAAERFVDGEATPAELAAAEEGADDSAFCNYPYDSDKWTTRELRKATLGDDAGWAARMNLSQFDDDVREEIDTYPDPDAWLDAEDDGDPNSDLVLSDSLDPFRDVAGKDAVLVGETIGRQVLLVVRQLGGRAREAEERAAQAALVRDVFGDPSPPASDPAWRTPDVVSLAEAIYAEKAFDRMPGLADAIEAAGCHDPAVLSHCRGPGPHVRGCWVLDLVLGKG